MSDERSQEQRKRMTQWLATSDDAMREAARTTLSDATRASLAFHSGYMCALHLTGPDALKLAGEHPSEKVLRAAAEAGSADTGTGLQYLLRRLDDPLGIPNLMAMAQWANAMRELVAAKRAGSRQQQPDACAHRPERVGPR